MNSFMLTKNCNHKQSNTTKKEAEESISTKLGIERLKSDTSKNIADTNEKIEKLRAETAKSFQHQTIWLSGIA